MGRPHVVDADGVERAVRGQKPWLLLARILLADRPLSRRELASELFGSAADPLGSLRWTLASLRKSLDRPDLLTGDPVDATLPADITVDVVEIQQGRLDLSATGELLEGHDAMSSPEIGTWLLVVRQQFAALVDDSLREETVRALSRGEWSRALSHAELAARRQPYDEGAQVLLVKALTMSGHEAAALDLVHLVEQRFRDELGLVATPALRGAMRRSVADPPPGVSRSAVVATLLDAGRAAVDAGAADAGIECLRRAVAEGEGDDHLMAISLLELGTSLVHSIRGFDDEGTVFLEQAVIHATEAGDTATAVAAMREHAYSDALLGRRTSAARRLQWATDAAGDTPALMTGVEAIRGFNLSDWGRLDESIEAYLYALELAQATDDARQEAWVRGLGAWAFVTSGKYTTAVEWALQSLDLVRSLRWVSFEPWPMLVIAEAQDHARRSDVPDVDLERSFAMSCQLSDPCWEAASCRLLAIRSSASGAHDEAQRWIGDAITRGRRATDTWVAMLAAVRETEAEVQLAAGDVNSAERTLRTLIGYAATHHLDRVVARAVDQLTALSG